MLRAVAKFMIGERVRVSDEIHPAFDFIRNCSATVMDHEGHRFFMGHNHNRRPIYKIRIEPPSPSAGQIFFVSSAMLRSIALPELIARLVAE